MQLTREIRFCLLPDGAAAAGMNSWLGVPAGDAVAPHLAVRVTLSGRVDARTGYLCDITLVDQRVRGCIGDVRAAALADDPASSAGAVLPVLWNGLEPLDWGTARLERLELVLSESLVFVAGRRIWPMMDVVQRFEFSAAHRLYSHDLTDEENRRIFGKCANPNGHGHNYVLEVAVRGTPDAAHGRVIPLHLFQQIVREHAIDRFDHKHLNLDCGEFATLNPSVENIAAVIWSRLVGRFDPARLQRVKVWETPKTSAEVTADEAG